MITKSPKFELQKMIVSKCVLEPIIWPREVRFANMLIKKYGSDPMFWLGFEPKWKIHTLGWYINKGKFVIDNYANKQVLEEKYE